MFKLKNLALSILMILSASLGGAKAYVDHQLRKKLDTSIQAVADKISLDYGDLHTSLLGSVILKNIHLTIADYEPLQIDTVRLHKAYQFYNFNKLPSNLHIMITKVHFPISNTTSPPPTLVSILGYAPYYLTAKELRGLGYTHINADIDIKAKVGPKKVLIESIINASTWGNFRCTAELVQLPVPTQWTAATLAQLQLITFRLSYQEQGLFNRVFTWLAQRNKMTLKDFKHTLITQLSNDLNTTKMGISSNELIKPLQQFIQNPRGLTLFLQPKSPTAIEALWHTPFKQLGFKMSSD